MGGIALGKGVLSSGLLADLDKIIESSVKGLDVWPILAIFSLLSLIVATFVSHSIASVLVAPIAAQIGQALDPPHPRLLIMVSKLSMRYLNRQLTGNNTHNAQTTALICSAGMGLPVSGFPNLMAVNLEDEVGNRYLNVNDFLKAGVSLYECETESTKWLTNLTRTNPCRSPLPSSLLPLSSLLAICESVKLRKIPSLLS